MSFEAALNNHAEAIRELAAALRERNAPLAALAGQAQTAIQAITEDMKAGGTVDNFGADNELEQAVEKVEAAAKEESPGRKAINAALEAARSAAKEEKAADPKPAASGAAEPEATPAGAEPLSYEKDVKPVLIKLAGAKGKQALTDLIASFGVPKADKLNAEQLVEAKKQAEKLIAG